MDILEEIDQISLVLGGGSELFKRIDALVNHVQLMRLAAEKERDNLRAVLAKAMPIPKKEPIGKVCKSTECGGVDFYFDKIPDGETMLYAEPQPAQAAAMPDGWQLVPVEPSTVMLDAGAKEIYGVSRPRAIEIAKEEKFDSCVEEARTVYTAMLSASQKPEHESKGCCEGGVHYGHSYDCKNLNEFQKKARIGGNMPLNEELKARVGQMADDAMKSPKCKESERQRIERETKEFLRRKGKVVELAPSSDKAESLRF